MFRISDNMNRQVLTRNLTRINEDLFRRNREVSSGKKLHSADGDPAGAARITRIRDEISRVNQYGRNMQRAQVLLGSTDQTLNSLRNILGAASERATFGLTATVEQAQRDTIAADIDEMLDTVVRLSATRIDGKNIFSGTETQTDPLAVVAGAYVYQGDNQPLRVDISKNRSIQISLPGDQVFTAAGGDLVNSLRQLADALRAADFTTARGMLENLHSAETAIDISRVKISESIQLIEPTQNEHERLLVAFTQELSSLEDADMAESISGLVQSETRLQAALQTGSRQRISLFDLLG